jgi:hypothetical protein
LRIRELISKDDFLMGVSEKILCSNFDAALIKMAKN